MRLLANPIIMRMALALLVSLAAFAAGILGVRALRRKLVDDESMPDSLGKPDDATYAYSAVIQKLKQQKFELQNEHTAQRRRAKSAEHITAAVIASLPCGILFIGPNGLVKQSNSAARQLLGFASPIGLSPEDLFRDTIAVPEAGEAALLSDAVKASLRGRVRAEFEISYETANGGDPRDFGLTLIPLMMDETAGLACVISDHTAVGTLKREELLRSEVSAEMALQLRASLSVIRDYAQRIGTEQHDAASLATDIAAEADRLDKIVGGFLAEPLAAKTATAST